MLASGSGSGDLPPCAQASSTPPEALTCISPVVLAAHMPPSLSAARFTTVEPPKRVKRFSSASKRASPPPSIPTQIRPRLSCEMVRA